jgi:threonyl-tRNA synthetase/competence protein ComGC
MSNREKLNQIRHTAAAILAHAVIDFDSKAFRVSGGTTPWGFYYDFIFVNPFEKEVLPLIEERMRQIVAKNEEIKVHEMIPMSAASFMRHHHHPYAAHFIEISPDPLVKVIQIGNFVDHVHEAFLDRTGELPAFKILKIAERSDLYFKGEKKRVIRIIGVADESKETLKDFLKKNKKRIGVDHLAIGSEMGLFKVDIYRDENFLEKGRIYWTQEGEALLHNIYEYWRKLHLKEKFELVVTSGPQITREHKKLYQLESQSCEERPIQYAEYRRPELDGGFPLEMGLLLAKNCHKDRSHIFCLKKDLLALLTSSLLFLNQLPELLEHQCSLTIIGSEALLPILKKGAETIDLKKDVSKGKESRIEWNIHDDFGRTFQGPFLTLSEKNEIFTIKRSLFPSVERMIAIILELHEKDLSQKKELLSKMGIFANLRIHELEN